VGIFYGFTHQRSITASQKAEHARREYEHKQELINKAKAEYAKLKNPAPAAADDGMLALDRLHRANIVALRP
jgi:F-type H+-transporting ATP synthase subunit e